MANKNFQRPRSAQRELIILAGKANIAADASVSSVAGDIASCVKGSTGTYTITLKDKYSSFQSVQLQVQSATVQDVQLQISAIDPAAKTISFKTVSVDGDGVVAAADVGAALVVNVSILAKNTSI